MTTNIITKFAGVTIDISRVDIVFDDDGYPLWNGKVVLVFRDRVALTTTKITSNWTGVELADFEGEPEEGATIYEACELYAPEWNAEIMRVLGKAR